ncbi:hypothetical protein [Streptomyces sp. NPDC051452]|uniref:hypothetical protein n=1 Tax=Streptomyces sp. NPDC051452 TaxID=3365654 RepID=UPI0037A7E65A
MRHREPAGLLAPLEQPAAFRALLLAFVRRLPPAVVARAQPVNPNRAWVSMTRPVLVAAWREAAARQRQSVGPPSSRL